MTVVKVTCEGETPLLMEPMPDEVLESLRTGNRLPPDKKSKAEEIAAKKIYANDDGQPGIPADNFWSCLVEAGTLVSYKGKKNLSTKEESLLGGLLRIEENFLVFNGHGSNYVVDKRRGRLPDGTAVCLVRPKFNKWGFSATIHINDKFVDSEKVKELVEMAGTFKGIGGHRKKGSFGRFKVTEWNVISGGNGASAGGKKRRGKAEIEAEVAVDEGGEENNGEQE